MFDPVRREIADQLGDHALGLGVHRHRAEQHVVEDLGGLAAEVEVIDALERVGEDLILRGSGTRGS